MSNVLRISEAASLALHAMILLAASPEQPASTGEIATALHASEAHLSKVLQRLGHAGLVKSTRGPRGGFVLGRGPETITLLDIYEVIEGPFASGKCLLNEPICNQRCIFGGLLESVSVQVRELLASKKLSDAIQFKLTEEIHA